MFDDLIHDLESASAGSPPLGARVLAAVRSAALLSFEQYGDELWIALEFSDGERCEIKHLRDPTSSIDAALPGEQIEVVSIQRAPPGYPQKWSALDANWPRNADGQYTCMRVAGIGHTEALARRIAALRARQAVPQTGLGTPSDTSNADPQPNTTTAPTGESDAT